MSYSDVALYYANLLIKQYNGLPEASGTVATLADMVYMNNLPTLVQNGFNILGTTELALGAQLDILGEYAGVSRSGVGVNGQPITLSDADFLTLIQLATAINSSFSSLSFIQAMIGQYFPGEMLVFDYANMQMSYLISSTIGSQNLVELFVTEGLLPRPMGVALSVIYSPTITKFFGMRTYEVNTINNSPLNSYSSYQTNRPWLSYANVFTS